MTKQYSDALQCPYKDIEEGVPHCGCVQPIKPPDVAEGYGGPIWGEECREDLTYYLDLRYAPVTNEIKNNTEYRQVFRDAFDTVEDTCRCRFREVFNENEALIIIRFERTGGSVLAWSHVGGYCGRMARQAYGTQWNWARDRLITVILHEVGHLMGLNHDSCVNRDGTANIMCWQVRQDILKYDPVTAKLLRQGYGDPIDGPKPPPPTPPPDPVPPPKPDPDPVPPPQPEPFWPLPYYYGEPLRNLIKFIANAFYYLFFSWWT